MNESVTADALEQEGVRHTPVDDDFEGGASLEFFLGNDPEVEIFAEKELPQRGKRPGLLFHMRALTDEEFKRSMDRATKKQNAQEKRRGVPVERDNTKLELLVLADSIEWIAVRTMTDEDAKRQNKRKNVQMADGSFQDVTWPYADPVELRDDRLLEKHGPRPEDLLKKWLLPGERTVLADAVSDVSGFGSALSDPVEDAGN